MLSFISPNKWFRANYGKKIRSFLADKCTVHSITDFQDSPVFEGATAYPMIFVAQKGKTTSSTIYTETRVPNGNIEVKAVIRKNGTILSDNAIKGENWSFVDKATADRIKQMHRNTVPLEIYVKGQIYYGIKTGFNKAFVIDDKKRKELIAEDPASEDLIKPVVEGKVLYRWYYNSNNWLIFTRRGVKIDKYPAIKKYLTRHRKELEPKPEDWNDNRSWPGRKAGPYKWFEIQDIIAYHSAFEGSQIVWGNLGLLPSFTFVKGPMYVNAPANTIPTDDLYLLGVLNSSSADFFFSHTAIQRNGGYYEYKPIYVKALPIPKASDKEKKAIEKLVQKCLDVEGQDCEKWEAEIDKIVTKLYGLGE